MTGYPVNAPGWTEAYTDEVVHIYENLEVLPRTFVVSHAISGPADKIDVSAIDYTATVWLEGAQRDEMGAPHDFSRQADPVFSHYAADDVRIQTQTAEPAWLVLTDAYFPGWQAALHGPGYPEEGFDVPILKANGSFRAVELPADFTGEVSIQLPAFGLTSGSFSSVSCPPYADFYCCCGGVGVSTGGQIRI